MAVEEIVIDIDTDGSVKVEGKGIQGPECTKLTAGIEAALGEVKKRTLKPDYRAGRVNVKMSGR